MVTSRQVYDKMVQLPRLERGTSRSTIKPDLNKFNGRLRDVAAKIPNARRVMPRNQPPKGTTMKNVFLTAGMIGAIFLPAVAFAEIKVVDGCEVKLIEGSNYSVKVDPACEFGRVGLDERGDGKNFVGQRPNGKNE